MQKPINEDKLTHLERVNVLDGNLKDYLISYTQLYSKGVNCPEFVLR